MKRLLLITLTLTIVGCGFSFNVDFPEDEGVSGSGIPEYIAIHYKFKKYDYFYEPWPYTMVVRCGWVFDPWMEDFEYMNVCNQICVERDRWETRPVLYPTFERCMYNDYQRQDKDEL